MGSVDKVDIPGFEHLLVPIGTGAPLAELKKEGNEYLLRYTGGIKPPYLSSARTKRTKTT